MSWDNDSTILDLSITHFIIEKFLFGHLRLFKCIFSLLLLFFCGGGVRSGNSYAVSQFCGYLLLQNLFEIDKDTKHKI